MVRERTEGTDQGAEPRSRTDDRTVETTEEKTA
jgi:hypothetical protein